MPRDPHSTSCHSHLLTHTCARAHFFACTPPRRGLTTPTSTQENPGQQALCLRRTLRKTHPEQACFGRREWRWREGRGLGFSSVTRGRFDRLSRLNPSTRPASVSFSSLVFCLLACQVRVVTERERQGLGHIPDTSGLSYTPVDGTDLGRQVLELPVHSAQRSRLHPSGVPWVTRQRERHGFKKKKRRKT